ncbi:hypothetical protein DFP73DRAFT_533578 [Morchella snyderi]|nr:hypothetical protein DFP73DRAFT_533578 [Morchella snyderi]
MARIRDIQRTAAFAWSPEAAPFIATGTQAGAVSADFSDNTVLELWDLDLENAQGGGELSPVASINTDSKFYDIAWGRVSTERPRGIIAGALENGSLDLWSADALLSHSDDPLVSRTTKHSGAIKALQFNPFKSELLATAGAKGELFVWDLNNTENPFQLGNRAARADDFDCLDWNKKVPHILVTGGGGGFLTVWDVKTKKESLTLNKFNRKAVSSVAWHPETQTKLMTAILDDTNPVIQLWDLRNSNAPERTLTGHQAGVLSLAWCKQDTDLLLSCGKDNRTICWNPQTGEMLGEFPTVTNWTFKTQWNPRNPGLSATASYDGKIVIQTLQNTNPSASPEVPGSAGDADDFFSRASNAQTSSFTLKQPPNWLRVPAGASFGFGGKLISFSTSEAQIGQMPHSIVKISKFAVDSGVNTETESFENALKGGNLEKICDQKVENAKTDQDKADWDVLRTLFKEDTRERLIEYLGFNEDEIAELKNETEAKETNGEEADGGILETAETDDKRLSSFFADTGAESENFLADLSSIQSTHNAKTNNPFQIFTGEESATDKKITRAVVLGQFDKAVDICLVENRISDAFMLAICGGEKCIEKVKTAYFKVKGPNYLRVLASVVGKNLWDIVHNADLANWKEVMVSLCSFAQEKDFADLCEALGDRLEDELRQGQGDKEARKHAAFCYLAGSKVEKVVGIWIEEYQENERSGLQENDGDSTFSVHARSLQSFIEKVTVFREAVKFVDEEKSLSANWKLQALYEKYCEYADIVASQGQLEVAARYLDLLPLEYPAATVARNRVKEASGKIPSVTATLPVTGAKPQQQPITSAFAQQRTATKSPYPPTQPMQTTSAPNVYQPQAPAQTTNLYTPAGTAPYNPYTPNTSTTTQNYTPQAPTNQNYSPQTTTQAYNKPNMYQPTQMNQPTGPYGAGSGSGSGGGYQQYGQPQTFQPPPQRPVPSSIPPPSRATKDVGNWNDTPEVVKIPPRRAASTTPGPLTSPFPNVPGAQPSPPISGSFGGLPARAPTAPPPRGALPPQRISSPAQHSRSQSPALQQQQQSGPYGAPVSQSFPPNAGYTTSAPPPPSGRYAPTPAAAMSVPPGRQNAALPPPPQGAALSRVGGLSSGPQYAPPPISFAQPSGSSQYTPTHQQPPSMYGHTLSGQQPGQYGPPAGSQHGPLGNIQPTTQSHPPPPAQQTPPPKPQTPAPQASKYPAGDRSHIPSQYVPIYELLTADLERVKQRAPPAFAKQVKDTEKRLNILFDHINNEELLSPEALESMLSLSRALFGRDYTTAHSIQVDLVTNRTAECNVWMTGVKRLIEMSKVTPE